MITRPMKAETLHTAYLDQFSWPGIASPKIDGIRCVAHPMRGPVTSSFKPQHNVHVRNTLWKLCDGSPLDGELELVHADGHPATFNETQSAMMSRGGTPLFRFRVFDSFVDPTRAYETRLCDAARMVEAIESQSIQVVEHEWVNSADEFLEVAARHVAEGYEGTMLRDPLGPYKSGRSTLKQGWLLKYKAWMDAEGVVIGFEELMRNENPDVRDELGLAKRGHSKDGKVPGGTLGRLVLNTAWGELRVGSGFDAALRQEIWNWNKDVGFMYENKQPAPGRDIGRVVTFKYIPYGMKSLPRHPIFKSFREAE